MLTMGVGDGDGKLFVDGDYDSIKMAQKKLFQREKLFIVLSAIANDQVAMGKDIHGDMYMDNSKTIEIMDFAKRELREILDM